MDHWFSNDVLVGLENAIARLHNELPGWWYSVGNCHVSADATVGPTIVSPDGDLLNIRQFDDAFSVDLRHPATLAEALNEAIDKALAAKSAVTQKQDDRCA